MSRRMNRRDRTINTERWRIRQRHLLEDDREVIEMVDGYFRDEGSALAAYRDRVDHHDPSVLCRFGESFPESLPPERALIQLEVRRAGEQRFEVVQRFEPHI
jgi:hypothetical protein